MFRQLASISTAVAVAVSGLVTGAAPASAASRAGVSMWNACVYQHGQPSSVGVTQGWNVMGWRCVYNGGWNNVQLTINVQKECNRTGLRFASYSDYNNPYGWYCHN